MFPERFIELGIGVEVVRNVAETTPTKWAKRVSANVLPRAEKVVDDNVRGRLEDSEGARTARPWFTKRFE